MYKNAGHDESHRAVKLLVSIFQSSGVKLNSDLHVVYSIPGYQFQFSLQRTRNQVTLPPAEVLKRFGLLAWYNTSLTNHVAIGEESGLRINYLIIYAQFVTCIPLFSVEH